MPANVDRSTLSLAIERLTSIPNVSFHVDGLADDLHSLIAMWPDEQAFLTVISSTVGAIELIVEDKALASLLSRDLAGWRSFHYPHSRSHRGKADMRIIYRRVGSEVQVLGFGHRYVPSDVYARLIDRAT